jgi:hypothetical protein
MQSLRKFIIIFVLLLVLWFCLYPSNDITNDDTFPISKEPNITISIFFHIGLIGTYMHRTNRIIQALNTSGLLERADEFYVVTVGDRNQNPVPPLPNNAIVFDGGPHLLKYEEPTITKLYEYALKRKDEKVYILYVHDKGASHDITNQAISDWVDLLIYFNIEKWQFIPKLLELHEIVCINFRPLEGAPHCSGNFWWTRADYVATLDKPIQSDQGVSYMDRLKYEFWIGTGLLNETNGNHLCFLFPNTVDHYFVLFPRSRYDTITNPTCVGVFP